MPSSQLGVVPPVHKPFWQCWSSVHGFSSSQAVPLSAIAEQSAEQQSPALVFQSSHDSPHGAFTIPSPQSQPTSRWQVSEQPSQESVSLSSHSSPQLAF